MSRTRRPRGVPVLLGLVAYGLAFAQRPGLATADTKINLHVDPGRFFSDVASMWTSTGQLGGVQTGQQAGYLFPMGPFFALGHALGLGDWVVQRLWLGTLLALAAWGVMRLLTVLLERSSVAAPVVGALVMMLNPFVVTYVNRTTVTLLAYAALPWLLLAVHRGVRNPRGWAAPAAFALLVAASGGGVNGAVTAWMLLGPALLLLYERMVAPVQWRDLGTFLARTVLLTVLVSMWWVIPAYVQTSYGADFLRFTEQPGTVWGTTSITESLRLMSFWLSYVGLGFAGRAIPYFDDSRTLLFSAPVVVATLLLPAAALGGFVWTRRWRYGPFFLGLAIVAVVVMGAGFPDGTPLRHGLYFVYNHFASVRFLRASYKAAPLLAVALACLAGGAAGALWPRLGTLARGLWWRTGVAVAGAAILVLAAWPLVSGRAQDAQVSFKRVPAAWRTAAADLDRELPPNSRAIVLPGDLFSFYTWGGTVDPILPALSRRPVAERSEVPYSDPRATDLLWTIDGLVHQQRLAPGQLAPLLSLIGVRSVVTGADDDLARSDAPAPADAAAVLSAQPGFARPSRTYGPAARFDPSGLGPAVKLPQVRRYDLPSARGLVRVEPRAGPIVVDGSAAAVAGLAAFDALPANRALLYSADLTAPQLRASLAQGGEVVISDSNARQAFVSGSLEQNVGPLLTPAQTVSADGIILDPLGLGSRAQTVARYSGIRLVQAPSSPQTPQFPEHAPFAAIDGSPATAWLADPTLGPSGRWLQVDFTRPRTVPFVDLLPYGDAGGRVSQVQIAGRTFAVHPGWNHLSLGVRAAGALRVALTGVTAPEGGTKAGAGGIRELRIPGVRAGESLRLPVDAAATLTTTDLDHVALSYLFARQTGDDPYQRDLAHGPWSAFDVRQPGDAEATMHRVFDLPARRRFDASAWVTAFPAASDASLDRLAGYRGAIAATSSSRFDGKPGYRASSALDGRPATAWIADYSANSPPWLRVSSPHPLKLLRLRLRDAAIPVRRPTRVRVLWPGGSTTPLPVTATGAVTLPRAVRTRSLKIVVVRAVPAPGATPAQRHAVGIAEVTGIGGLVRLRTRRSGSFAASCPSVRVRVGTAVLALRVAGSVAAFDSGTPLPARSCGPRAELGPGTERLSVDPGALAVDQLRLFSAAPQPRAAPVSSGQVLDSGTAGRGSYRNVRVAISSPSWLVLGEGYDRGWRASCNGRSLGAPMPIDGYANGWRVSPGCRQVSFVFAPNRLAAVGYAISGLSAVVCVLLLAVQWWRRRRTAARRVDEPVARRWEVHRLPPIAAWRAVALAVPAAVVFGFVFGVIPGLVGAVALAVILWRGIGAPALTLSAAGLLGIVVPVLYLVHPGSETGGNHFGYASQHLAAHYVGVAAVGLLAVALALTVVAARWPRAGP
jgi:arabinofuranan 3-O-arabinosyltransferase